MKITKRQLKRIIKEEKAKLLKEESLSMRATSNIDDVFYDLQRNLSAALGEAGASPNDPAVLDYIMMKMEQMKRSFGV